MRISNNIYFTQVFGGTMSDVTNRLGLPTFISDYAWDGTSVNAVSQAASVTSGALLVSLANGNIAIDPATQSVHGSSLMTFGVPVNVCTLNVLSAQLYSMQAAASAGPVKVEIVNNSSVVAVRFFNSAFPNTDMVFPTGFVVSGTVDIVMTNLYSDTQTGYATIFYN
jgi:hypothetical protein